MSIAVGTGQTKHASVIPPPSVTPSVTKTGTINSVTPLSPTTIHNVTASTGTVAAAENPQGGTIVKKGYSPYINGDTLTWWEYDDTQKVFIDTGITAQGPQGEDGKDGEDGKMMIAGAGLLYDEETNVLSVNTATDAIEDNTLPITSGAVYKEIGNIDVLLQLI